VISSNAVRTFITGGGKLLYLPFDDETADGKRRWELVAVSPEGELLPVMVARTGEPRIFRSANALAAYHEDMFPGSTGVFIPFKSPETPSET
jgi:hypothetical protein